MDPRTKQPPVNTMSKYLVRIAEEKFATGGEEYNCLCDIAHELDLLYTKAASLEARCAQMDAKLYACALVLRP